MEKRKKDGIGEEMRTVDIMIRYYCRHKEGNEELCPSCQALLEYAHRRLTRCPFGGMSKPSCRLCRVHCYSPDMQRRIQAVMRYAGPRMLWHHPFIALRHLWREFHSPSCDTGRS